MFIFLMWFIIWGVSFLVSDILGWVSTQGLAFLLIYLGYNILFAIILYCSYEEKLAKGIITSQIFIIIVDWIISFVFKLDFLVVYQVMTFIFAIL